MPPAPLGSDNNIINLPSSAPVIGGGVALNIANPNRDPETLSVADIEEEVAAINRQIMIALADVDAGGDLNSLPNSPQTSESFMSCSSSPKVRYKEVILCLGKYV